MESLFGEGHYLKSSIVALCSGGVQTTADAMKRFLVVLPETAKAILHTLIEAWQLQGGNRVFVNHRI